MESLRQFFKKGYHEGCTDQELASKFGLTVPEIAVERRASGYKRKRGNAGHCNNKIDSSKLWPQEKVVDALVNGGYTGVDILREVFGETITRQRFQQILFAKYGIKVEEFEEKRTTLWHAARLLGKGNRRAARLIATRKGFLETMKRAGSIRALAGRLNVSLAMLVGFAHRNYGISRSGKPITEIGKRIRLKCPKCKRFFHRSRAEVRRTKRQVPGSKFFCSNSCKWKWARGKKLPRKNK